MHVSSKARLLVASQAALTFALFGLAVQRGGGFIAVAAIGIPLLVVFVIVYLGAVPCPNCGNNACGPAPGETDMNPYYRLIWHGRCACCKTKI